MAAAIPITTDQKLIAYQLREYRRMADEARERGLVYALEHLETRIAQLERLEKEARKAAD